MFPLFRCSLLRYSLFRSQLWSKPGRLIQRLIFAVYNFLLILDRCLELSPNDPKALFRRCQAYEAVDKCDAAYKDARECHRIDPNNPALQPVLVRLHKAVSEKVWKFNQSFHKNKTLLWAHFNSWRHLKCTCLRRWYTCRFTFFQGPEPVFITPATSVNKILAAFCSRIEKVGRNQSLAGSNLNRQVTDGIWGNFFGKEFTFFGSGSLLLFEVVEAPVLAVWQTGKVVVVTSATYEIKIYCNI